MAGFKITNGVLERYEGHDTEGIIPEGVTSIGEGAFRDCSGLICITLPESVTSIGESAFYDCSNLTSINIPDSVVSVGKSAFSNCEKLTSVIIPKSTEIADDAFDDNVKITRV